MLRIKLTQGKFALIDEQDLELIAPYTWCAAKEKEGYFTAVTRIAVKNGKQRQKSIKMHRLLMSESLSHGLVVDHINGNPLDNRRENLRICTRRENTLNSKKPKTNSTGYKGVSYSARMKKYKAAINVNSSFIHLGYFICPIEAARAYDKAALNHFGEFAKTNNL